MAQRATLYSLTSRKVWTKSGGCWMTKAHSQIMLKSDTGVRTTYVIKKPRSSDNYHFLPADYLRRAIMVGSQPHASVCLFAPLQNWVQKTIDQGAKHNIEAEAYEGNFRMSNAVGPAASVKTTSTWSMRHTVLLVNKDGGQQKIGRDALTCHSHNWNTWDGSLCTLWFRWF